jgi:hypothetical protein
MRRLQALAALLWMTYGLLIHAAPIVGANVVVATLAIWSARGSRAARPHPVARGNEERKESEVATAL